MGPTAYNEMIATEFAETNTAKNFSRIITVFLILLHQQESFITAVVNSFVQNRNPIRNEKNIVKELWMANPKTLDPQNEWFQKLLTSATDTKLRDRKGDETAVTVKLVPDRIIQDTRDKTHGREFIRTTKSNKKLLWKIVFEKGGTDKKYAKQFVLLCETQNWSTENKSQTEEGNFRKCGKKSHYAEVCRTKLMNKLSLKTKKGRKTKMSQSHSN